MTDQSLQEQLNNVASEMSVSNVYDDEEIRSKLPLVSAFVRILRQAYSQETILNFDDIPTPARGRMGAVADMLISIAFDQNKLQPLEDALIVLGVTYRRDESYHTFHYDLATIEYCADRLGSCLSDIAERVNWGLTSEVREFIRNFALHNRGERVLDSFELEIVVKNGRSRFRQRRR